MTENYQPTTGEVERARQPSDELKVSGDGVFATLQGEGVSAGRPSVFLRLQNCNLHCGFEGKGWACDAWYTWNPNTPEYWQETRLASVGDIAEELQQSWQSNFADVSLKPNLVITGGEPLLQQDRLARLVSLLSSWSTEVETNGTIVPGEYLWDTQINCSPKLASSGNARTARIRETALKTIATFPNHWFKFVVSCDEDLEEVKRIMDDINGGDFSRVLLMNEGVSGAELAEKDERLFKIAHNLGCAITARNHIFWYGDKRAT